MRLAKGRTARHEFGRMNRVESAYAAVLSARLKMGEVAGWWFEPIKLRLADKTFYSPDFLVMLADGTLELHEVKTTWGGGQAGWHEDARVKWKVAAEAYPMFAFVAAVKGKAGWTEERYR
jgi:hypothetical protein